MARRLILVRHCDEESWLPSWPRLTDVHAWQEDEDRRPLTEIGTLRARDVARRVASQAPEAILCSPLLRARQTAERIAEATGLEVGQDAALAEVPFGHVRGLEPRLTRGWRRLLTRIPAPRPLWSPLMRGLWLLGRTRGALSPDAVIESSRGLRLRLEEAAEARTVVVVAHGVNLLFLRAVLLDRTSFAALRAENRLKTGEYCVLERRAGAWSETGRGRGLPTR